MSLSGIAPPPVPSQGDRKTKPVPLDCPACGRGARIPAEFAGKRVRCPGCSAEFRVATDLSRLIGTVTEAPPAPPRRRKSKSRPEPPPVRRKTAKVEDAPPSSARRWILVACWCLGLVTVGFIVNFFVQRHNAGAVDDNETVVTGDSPRKSAQGKAVEALPANNGKPAPADPPKKPVVRDGDRLVQLDKFDAKKLEGLKVTQPTKALEQTTELALNSKPLFDVLKVIAEKHRIPIVVDNTALADEGIPLKKWPVTVSIKGVTLADAFEEILGPVQLKMLLPTPDAKAIIITSEIKAAGLDANKLLNNGTVASTGSGLSQPSTKATPKRKPAKRKASRKQSPQALVRSGKRLVGRRKFDEAIAEFNKALKIRRKDVEALYNRGYAYLLKKDNRRAVNDFTAVIRLRKNHRAAYLSRALAYTRLGRRESARADRIAANRLRRKK